MKWIILSHIVKHSWLQVRANFDRKLLVTINIIVKKNCLTFPDTLYIKKKSSGKRGGYAIWSICKSVRRQESQENIFTSEYVM